MATWAPKFGETFLVPSGPRQGQMHLHIVLNDPKPLAGFSQFSCAVACICSVPDSKIPFDDTREFAPGTHAFIVKQSYVNYGFFTVMPAQHLIQCVTNGPYSLHQPMDAQYVESIIHGYRISRRVPRTYKGLDI